MKRYRHREDGYEIRAVRYCNGYRVEGYQAFPPFSTGFEASLPSVCLATKDFVRLFEPVPEYCCDEFKRMVNRKVFKRSPGYHGNRDRWYLQYETNCSVRINGCPFCERKLE